jgi:hypothetical protein
LRQTITQPASRAGEYFYIFAFKANFFVQLAVQGVFRRFIRVDASLWKLPGVLIDTASPKYLTSVICQNNPDIRAETIGVDHGNNLANACHRIVPQRLLKQQRAFLPYVHSC